MTIPRRREDIQGIRALAVVMVIAYHAGVPLHGGFCGVDDFFVISGFVIMRMLLAEISRSDRLALGNFYLRRARRLLPALSLVTLVTVLAAAFLEPPTGPEQLTGAMGRATSLFFANIEAWLQPGGYFATGSITDPLLHMWSLGVEEQFYLLMPAALWLCWKSCRRFHIEPARGLAAGLFLVSAVSFAFCFLATPAHNGLAFFWIQSRAWEFGIGSLVALGASWLERQNRRNLGELSSVLGLAGIIVAAFEVKQQNFPGASALIPALSTGLLLGGGCLAATGVAARILTIRPLVTIGDASYSLYIWHWPMIVILRAALPDDGWAAGAGALFSVPIALASYRFVEQPFRRRALSMKGRVGLGVICIVLPFLGATALSVLAKNGWGSSRNVRFAREAATNAVADNEHCLMGATANYADLARCTYQRSGSRDLIVLVGDSHAAALSNGVVTAGEELGYKVQVSAASACPFNRLAALEDMETYNCGQVFGWNMERFRRNRRRIALVVISEASSAYVADLRGRHVAHPEQVWANAVRSAVVELVRESIPVLVVLDVPRITRQPEACRFGGIFPIDCAVSWRWVERTQGAEWQSETKAIRSVKGAASLSLIAQFCHDGSCDAIQRGELMYYDNQHLDQAGSDYVEPRLLTGMRQALSWDGRERKVAASARLRGS